MADLTIFAPIDMINEDHLGASYLVSQISSSNDSGYNKNGLMTSTTYLSSGFTEIDRYRSDMKSIYSSHIYEKELKGRFKLTNFKLYHHDWISIYGSDAFYSDLPLFSAANIEENSSRRFPGLEVEIFAKILSQADRITGSSGSDFLYAYRGDDLIMPQGGDDFIHGGSGVDTVRLTGSKSQYELRSATDLSGVQYRMNYSQGEYLPVYMGNLAETFEVSGPSGSKTLVSIEKIQFDDGTYDVASNSFSVNNVGQQSDRKNSKKGMRTRKDKLA
jgi:Ca2+-binding RTX toxin-like protein